MPAVRVERLPVQMLGLGRLGFDHLQLVFQSDFRFAGARQDAWFVIEGLREPEGSRVRLAVEGWAGGTTLSDANGGLTGDELIQRIGTADARGARDVALGAQALETWATLVSFAADIEAQQFPYIALTLPGSPLPTINSSSLVASLLHHAGFDIASVAPSGLRFSPGTKTLLGTSHGDRLAADRRFSTVVAGDGPDDVSGSSASGQIDKLFGGKGNDTFHWSAGFNIVHGGQPELAYADDGDDTIDYSGAGVVKIEAPAASARHLGPDFIATHDRGTDHLFSIEKIAWDGGGDRLVIGNGVGLTPARLTIDFWERGGFIDLSQADAGFEIRSDPHGGLRVTGRDFATATDRGLTILGADRIAGSPKSDHMALPTGLGMAEGGDGDDVLDVRDAAPIVVAGGAGADTLVVGRGAVTARGGDGRDRYVIADPDAALVIEDPSPLDRIVLGWSPSHVAAAYDINSSQDLLISLFPERGEAGGAQIRLRGFEQGDLGLDVARGLTFQLDKEGPMPNSDLSADLASDLDRLMSGGPEPAGHDPSASLLDALEAGLLDDPLLDGFACPDLAGVASLPQSDALHHG